MDRLVIALVFNLDEKWIGGGYYIRNVVSALGKLPAVERPSILMISDNRRSYDFIAETGYPDLTWLTREQFDPRSTEFAIDATFPWALPGVEEKAVSWIPDLQEHHLPAFFSKEEIEGRQNWHRSCFQTAGLILSSQAVLDDVDRFYPNQGQDKKVVHFATFDTLDKSTVAETVERYDLGERYVLCPNQLWIHKNHVVALDALRILKQRGKDISLYFTGNDHDHRAVGYSRFLKQRIADWGLTENVRFLGFLPRGDQLALMSGANYILQPSLFEGWSTVIEDAKAMSQFVLASDLDVHKEQLNTNFELFDRSNPQALADAMERLHDAPPAKEELDYSKAQQQFGRDFVSAVAHFVDGRQRASGISFDEILRMTTKNLDETVDDKSDNPAEPTSIAIEPKKSPPLAKKKWPALKSSNELDGPIPATRVKSFPVNFFTMLSRSFDRTWYRRTYGENVSTKPLAVLNAVLKLDRSPTPFFDPKFYREHYPEAVGNSRSSFAAFCRHGLEGNHRPGFWFDPDYYIRHNEGMRELGWPVFRHFILHGLAENRPAHPLFDPKLYAEQNPDVAAAGFAMFSHFLRYGLYEGRAFSPFFDVDFYSKNAGLPRSDDPVEYAIQATDHFFETGMQEDIAPCPMFLPAYYLRANQVVLRHGETAFMHFLRVGKDMDLAPHPAFDPGYYHHIDPAIRDGGHTAFGHYMRFGHADGRPTNKLGAVINFDPEFSDPSNYLASNQKHNPWMTDQSLAARHNAA